MWTPTASGANKKLVLHVQLRFGSLSITTPVSHLANEFDVRSESHGQVSLAAVNQILCRSWGYERLQNNSKDSLKDCFENVNITRFHNWSTKHAKIKDNCIQHLLLAIVAILIWLLRLSISLSPWLRFRNQADNCSHCIFLKSFVHI